MQLRLASKPRHGLLPINLSHILLIGSWALAAWAVLQHARADRIDKFLTEQAAVISDDFTLRHLINALHDVYIRHSGLGISLGTAFSLSILLVQAPLSYLLSKPVYSERVAAFFGLVAALVASRYGYAGWLVADEHAAAADPSIAAAKAVELTAVHVGLSHALFSVVVLIALRYANIKAERDDDVEREKIESLMRDLDKDGDGEVRAAVAPPSL